MDNNKKTIEEKILDAEESVIDPDVSRRRNTIGGKTSSSDEPSAYAI